MAGNHSGFTQGYCICVAIISKRSKPILSEMYYSFSLFSPGTTQQLYAIFKFRQHRCKHAFARLLMIEKLNNGDSLLLKS